MIDGDHPRSSFPPAVDLARAKLVELLEETGGIYDVPHRDHRRARAVGAAISDTFDRLANVDPRVVSRRRTVPGDLPDEVGCRFHSPPELNCYRCFTADRETTG